MNPCAEKQVRMLVMRALIGSEALKTEERADLLDGAATVLAAVKLTAAAAEAKATAALLREAERTQLRFIQIL